MNFRQGKRLVDVVNTILSDIAKDSPSITERELVCSVILILTQDVPVRDVYRYNDFVEKAYRFKSHTHISKISVGDQVELSEIAKYASGNFLKGKVVRQLFVDGKRELAIIWPDGVSWHDESLLRKVCDVT